MYAFSLEYQEAEKMNSPPGYRDVTCEKKKEKVAILFSFQS